MTDEKPEFPIVVELEDPVTFDGREYAELQFRKMKGKDALLAEGEKDELKASWILYATLSGTKPGLFEEMAMDDLETVAEKTAICMGKSAAALMKKAKAEALSLLDGET